VSPLSETAWKVGRAGDEGRLGGDMVFCLKPDGLEVLLTAPVERLTI
jgi:hypothetical protein